MQYTLNTQSILRYQSLVVAERRALLRLPESRVALANFFQETVRKGLMPKVKRTDLLLLAEDLTNGKAEEAVVKSESLPINAQRWHSVRSQVVAQPNLTLWVDWNGLWEALVQLRNEILAPWWGVVVTVQKRHFPDSPFAEDLQAEGIWGLLDTLERMDPQKPDYASWLMRRAAQKAMAAFLKQYDTRDQAEFVANEEEDNLFLDDEAFDRWSGQPSPVLTRERARISAELLARMANFKDPAIRLLCLRAEAPILAEGPRRPYEQTVNVWKQGCESRLRDALRK